MIKVYIKKLSYTFYLLFTKIYKIKSKLCNLKNLTPKDMVAKGEEQHDLGGYFIVKGNERLLRLLIMPRRNYVCLFFGCYFD
jgi:hypothetical protein